MEPGTFGSSELRDLFSQAREIASDADHGASELLARLLPLLDQAIARGPGVTLDVARIVCGGQSAMAPLWHACAAAAMDHDHPGTFARARAEMTRAPDALVRATAIALRDLLNHTSAPLVLTLSYSASVFGALSAVARGQRLRVVCGEGRPRFEGRRLAEALSDAGAHASVVVDAAVTAFLADATAVVIGADAVRADSWINKVGSFGLAAAASFSATPVYVVATQDKFVPAELAPRLASPTHDAEEVWPQRPSTMAVANVYFESIPAELATLFLTEAGPLGASDLQLAVERRAEAITYLLRYL